MFFKRKEIWVPTWRGWVALLLVAVMLGAGAALGTVPFLAAIQPNHHGVLVVEGWVPDYALEEAKAAFEAHSYKLLIVTGVPIEQGSHLSVQKDYAHLAASTLHHLGMKDDLVVPVACPEVRRDRTYTTACRVREWLEEKSITEPVDVFTLGVHARRTWLLYRMALGSRYHTGVIASADRRYDPRRWWTSSSGFRTVTSEVIAYVYAKLLFFPAHS